MTAACRLCGVPLHQAPDAVTDEFVWADADGRQTGPDADLAHLKPGPYGRLAWLAGELGRAQAVSTKRASRTWL
jgi:hypothetical protein